MSVSPHLITPPTDDVVTLEQVKAHLNVDFTDDDSKIRLFRDAVVGQLDPAKGGWLGRALRPQQWQLRLDGFPCYEVALPFPPLISVDEFEYDDGEGVEQPLVVETGYRIIGGGGLIAGKSLLVPAYNGSWPAARCDHGSVRITFTAGYPAGDSPDTLPAPIKAWCLLQIGTLYNNRESVVGGVSVASLPEHILQMLAHYRIF